MGVTGHLITPRRWARRDLVLRDTETDQLFSFPVAVPEFVWAQLANVLDEDDLVALGDAIIGGDINPDIRGGGPLATIDDLRRAVERHQGCRGAKAMARAVDLIRSGSLSRPESLLRVMLVRAGLPEPLPNRRVTDLDRRLIAMPDLCWPDYRVLIEYQGDGHRASRGKFRSDIRRLDEFQDGGWLAIQASADVVFVDPNPFAARMWRRLVTRGWHPGRRHLRRIVNARA